MGAIGQVYVNNGLDQIEDGANDCPPKAEAAANLLHIARCSPDRIGVLLDAFDAQTKAIAELRAALEPFAIKAERDVGSDESDRDMFRPMMQHNEAPHIRVGDLRRARSALRAKENPNG
jgi:hypothetical protein